MAPPAAIHCCVLIMIVTASLLIHPSITICCDNDDYYDLLGVTEMPILLRSRKLTTSCLLSSLISTIRARYYHAYYGHKTDTRAVLVGLLLVLSAFQYLNQLTRLLIWSRKLELQIKGAEKPTVWGLLGVRFILLPYTVVADMRKESKRRR
ncbi:chaperone protein dnaJ 50-like isoform X2 [Primulina tabacum]|uniref:chaperone protein dnaJ 50-like isoform X2 n=1 Tax=Primulina tabacum TaxID=48773 RepID=UPI003F5A50B9